MTTFARKAASAILGGLVIITIYLVASSPQLPKFRHQKFNDDYNTLIDIPFNFLHIPECRQENNFIVLVHTSPTNIGRRNILRQSWASANETDIDIFFLTGEAETKSDRPKLEQEIREYNNFIQGDFIDTYRNLTYKHVMGLKYVFYHCRNIEYVIKVDDDVTLNRHILKKFFKMLKDSGGFDDKMICKVRPHDVVPREGKWAVDIHYYPNKTYPPFCIGFTLIYPRKVVEMIYPAAQKMGYYWVDDVHITGIVAKEMGVKHVDISKLIVDIYELPDIMSGKFKTDSRPVLVGPPNMEVNKIKQLYQFMSEHSQKASIVDYLS